MLTMLTDIYFVKVSKDTVELESIPVINDLC